MIVYRLFTIVFPAFVAFLPLAGLRSAQSFGWDLYKNGVFTDAFDLMPRDAEFCFRGKQATDTSVGYEKGQHPSVLGINFQFAHVAEAIASAEIDDLQISQLSRIDIPHIPSQSKDGTIYAR